MSHIKRTCQDCGKKGQWTTYVIWDKDNPGIGASKKKHYICFECVKKEAGK